MPFWVAVMNIVVVNHSRVIRRIVERIAVARGDHVETFATGAAALDHLAGRDDVDIVMVGLELADIDGLELCWQVRAGMPRFASLQIIAMSGDDEKQRLAEALDSGADDYLRLPFGESEFLARLRSCERLIIAQREVFRMATTDQMTGVLNRATFIQEVEAAMANMSLEIPMSLTIVDIDHFKMVNDTFGHEAGDAALRAVCSCFDDGVGVFGRLGGEEFGWLLTGFELHAAHEACDDARWRIAELDIDVRGQPISVTASFGLTGCFPGEAVADVLRRADIALYDAKDAGRNCVVVNDATSDVDQLAV